MVKKCSIVGVKENGRTVIARGGEGGSEGRIHTFLLIGHKYAGIILKVFVGAIYLENDFLIDIEPSSKVGVGGTKNFLIGELVESIDIAGCDKIILSYDFFVDDVHDGIDDEEGDECDEKECECELAGE